MVAKTNVAEEPKYGDNMQLREVIRRQVGKL